MDEQKLISIIEMYNALIVSGVSKEEARRYVEFKYWITEEFDLDRIRANWIAHRPLHA